MPKIVFFNTCEAEVHYFPIVPASEYKFRWQKEDRQQAKESTGAHYFRCPSMKSSLVDGFLLINPLDIFFEFDHDNNTVKWNSNAPAAGVSEEMGKAPVEFHNNHFLRDKSKIASGSIIKIQTGWNVGVSDDTKLLYSNVFTPDDMMFTACSNTHSPYLSPRLNAQGMLLPDADEKTYVLKAGVPLMQIIPLTDKPITYEVREANNEDKKFIERHRYLHHRQQPSGSKNKNMLRSYRDWQTSNGFKLPWYKKLWN